MHFINKKKKRFPSIIPIYNYYTPPKHGIFKYVKTVKLAASSSNQRKD